MKLSEAIELIQHDSLKTGTAATWADLGCGSGLFSFALASLLGAGSTIHAVDKKIQLKDTVAASGVLIKTVQADFEKDRLDLHDADGIIMANSLHFIKDKDALINKLKSYLSETGCFIIVEYDTDTPVATWVPYPVGFSSLVLLFKKIGYGSVQKIATRPSAYGNGALYAAVIKKNLRNG